MKLISIQLLLQTTDHSHKNLLVAFPGIGKQHLGDTYYFLIGYEGNQTNPYQIACQQITQAFQKDLAAIQSLPIGSSTCWFFHFFDEYRDGLKITRTDEGQLHCQYCTELFYSNEFIYTYEFQIARTEFLLSLQEAIHHLCEHLPVATQVTASFDSINRFQAMGGEIFLSWDKQNNPIYNCLHKGHVLLQMETSLDTLGQTLESINIFLQKWLAHVSR